MKLTAFSIVMEGHHYVSFCTDQPMRMDTLKLTSLELLHEGTIGKLEISPDSKIYYSGGIMFEDYWFKSGTISINVKSNDEFEIIDITQL